MARVIAFTNQKGGVGKTTTATAFCGGLTLKGKRVLAIDLDPQGNLSFSFGAEDGGHTIHDRNNFVQHTLYEVIRIYS